MVEGYCPSCATGTAHEVLPPATAGAMEQAKCSACGREYALFDEEWCNVCEADTPHTAHPDSQGSTRAPVGSVFGFLMCARCNHGHGVCLDGALHKAPGPAEFAALGAALDAAGDSV